MNRKIDRAIDAALREADQCYRRGDWQGGYTLEGWVHQPLRSPLRHDRD